MEAARLLTKFLIFDVPMDFNCHFLKESASVYWLRSFRKIALFDESPSAVIRSLTRGCSFNHFGSPTMAFGSFPIDILTNVLILERFADNVLSRFAYLGERGGREATSFFEEGWTLPREGWMTSSSFPRKG